MAVKILIVRPKAGKSKCFNRKLKQVRSKIPKHFLFFIKRYIYGAGAVTQQANPAPARASISYGHEVDIEV